MGLLGALVVKLKGSFGDRLKIPWTDSTCFLFYVRFVFFALMIVFLMLIRCCCT